MDMLISYMITSMYYTTTINQSEHNSLIIVTTFLTFLVCWGNLSGLSSNHTSSNIEGILDFLAGECHSVACTNLKITTEPMKNI